MISNILQYYALPVFLRHPASALTMLHRRVGDTYSICQMNAPSTTKQHSSAKRKLHTLKIHWMYRYPILQGKWTHEHTEKIAEWAMPSAGCHRLVRCFWCRRWFLSEPIGSTWEGLQLWLRSFFFKETRTSRFQ